MTEKRWSLNTNIIEGTNICEKGIPHTNRSIVTHLNRYERELDELRRENKRFVETIKSAIENERTELGKSVLTQLADQLGVEL